MDLSKDLKITPGIKNLLVRIPEEIYEHIKRQQLVLAEKTLNEGDLSTVSLNTVIVEALKSYRVE